LNLDRRLRLLQRLQVGVGNDKLDAFDPCFHHPVDGIAAAAPMPITLMRAPVIGGSSSMRIFSPFPSHELQS